LNRSVTLRKELLINISEPLGEYLDTYFIFIISSNTEKFRNTNLGINPMSLGLSSIDAINKPKLPFSLSDVCISEKLATNLKVY
jgi:hypothetical protein